MASVLSGWYGYNLFNVANFIEFAEPFPKRRKLDKANSYNRSAEQVTEVVASHRDSAKRVKSQCSVTYRPYISELSVVPTQKKASCKRASKSSENSLGLRSRVKSEELKERDGTTIENLFPEILCLIFEKLDLQSKGRAAQVKKKFSHQKPTTDLAVSSEQDYKSFNRFYQKIISKFHRHKTVGRPRVIIQCTQKQIEAKDRKYLSCFFLD